MTSPWNPAAQDAYERAIAERLKRAVDLVVAERLRAWEYPEGSGWQTQALDKSLTFARGVAKALDVGLDKVIAAVQAIEKARK